MDHIFMHNFRGFSETVLPMKQLTFLVGENSTGKSSFLKLLYLLSQPQFWFSPERAIQEEADLGGFDDIVSAFAEDRSFFQIGVLVSHKKKKASRPTYKFTVYTFSSKDGSPEISRYLQFTDGRLTKFIFQPKSTKYKRLDIEASPSTDEEALQLFRQLVQEDREDNKGFSLFPKDVPPKPPLLFAMAILQAITKKKPLDEIDFTSGRSFVEELPTIDLTWIAPIRTKPQRFYDGMRKTFTPEGDHTPFILRKSLRAKRSSQQFAENLKIFGESSGLYETIVAHSFDRSPQSPFEILVKFAGGKLNIKNVGYGISQILPLIVEFLSREDACTFAVQQPEVHLHPRAQAALGDLVIDLASQKKHGFFFETHSDYLIDRCRLNISKTEDGPEAQVIFFQRTEKGNLATVLDIDENGRYPTVQPPAFRDFFVREEMQLLEV